MSEETMEIPTTPPPGMVDVYDKDGVKHRMIRPNALDMVQHLGWAWRVAGSAPVPAKPSVVVLISRKDAAQTASKPEETEQVDLSTLDRDALADFAKEHFDMEFKKTVTRDAIMEALLQERT